MGYGELGDGFQGDEMGLLAYFAETYIGRRGGPVARRRPRSEREWRSLESRIHTGGLSANNAIESIRDAFAFSIAQADSSRRGPIPRIGTYASEYELWGDSGFRKYTTYSAGDGGNRGRLAETTGGTPGGAPRKAVYDRSSIWRRRRHSAVPARGGLGLHVVGRGGDGLFSLQGASGLGIFLFFLRLTI